MRRRIGSLFLLLVLLGLFASPVQATTTTVYDDALAANTWSEVQVSLTGLGAANQAITGLVWQDASDGSQPTFYLDDLAFSDDAGPADRLVIEGYPVLDKRIAGGTVCLYAQSVTTTALQRAKFGAG